MPLQIFFPCRKQASFQASSPQQGTYPDAEVDWQLSKLRRSKYEGGEWELMTRVGAN